EELHGDFRFRHLVTLTSTEALEALKKHLKNTTGKTPGSPEAPYLLLTDAVEQFLMLAGITHFIGMEFAQLRRLQLHIETYISAGFEYASAAREGDRIVAIAIADNRGFEHVIRGDQMDERAMLTELVRIVGERDPDVIEGHNLFRANLEYLEHRARHLGVKLALGRDRSVMYARPARLQIAERTIAYRRFEAYGRNLVDTWILAQHYDIGSRELESFELRELAKHLGVTREGRVYLDARLTSHYFDHDPEALFQSALEEVRETRDVAEALSASYFVQAQIFPYSYQNAILRGNATKIDALMLRAYLAQHLSIPGCGEPRAFAGGYTEMRRCGVARNVFHCDVTSLYPSMMLEFGHAPASDALGVFLKMLGDLRSFRIKAKALARELSGSTRKNIEALQQTFKILINSFYGYLGFSMGHFNDFDQAGAVTQRGRDLIQSAITGLEKRDAKVIEVDTDGIYFVLPGSSDSDAAADAMLAEIAALMPAGIKLEIDGKYAAMFSYKMKNYVLLEATGEMTIRGSGLKSRGLERFQRRFMEEMFLLLMTDRHVELPNLFAGYLAKIAAHQLGIDALMKTETLQDSLANYRDKVSGKRRNAAAAYELALKSSRAYVAGDQVSYYVTGRGAKVKVSNAAKFVSEYDAANPDENIEYYQAKLTDLYEKFRVFAEKPGLFAAAELDKSAAEVAEESQQDFFSTPEK
ncbi:MAG TPA: DNA polymerase domain-containing protein, partial [Candidatus Binataceae bacterium]|nr:DNA polymerase domain-containing protein [Candidatus Binataceae bacterium]